jgi:zinc transport system permease protein
MKIVGVLLITSLLLIPAAAVRNLATSPERMAVYASIAGCVAVIAGLSLSYLIDTPAGPSVVLCAFLLFLSTLVVQKGLNLFIRA